VPIFLSAMRLLHFMHTGESSKNMRKIQFPQLKLLMISGLLRCFVVWDKRIGEAGGVGELSSR
jgi:hypothetical protein